MDREQTHLGSLGLSSSRTLLAIKSLFDHGLSFWLQPSCFLCEKFTLAGSLCEHCNSFEKLIPPYCLCCGDTISFDRKWCGKCEKRKKWIKQARSHYWLSESAQKVLHEIKFRADYPTLTFLIHTHLKQISLPELPKGSWVVPVPLARGSFLERGFNQSEIVARKIGKIHNLPVVSDALIKTKNTQRQSWLNTPERQKNLRGAFAWNKKYTPPQAILLVDDVYTTGSTLRECAKVLKKLRVSSVYAWTFFRTPKKQD